MEGRHGVEDRPVRSAAIEGQDLPPPQPDAAAEQAAPSPDFPERLGDYSVLELLGEGGMARVFRARDPRGREVAIKVIREARNAERLLREGKLAARLHHPGILPVHAAGREGESVFLVFPVIEGARTLDEVLPGLDLPVGLELLARVADALAHAHERGVLHRDVKPENVLVDLDGHPRLTDFGVATADDLERLTHTGAVVGTPLYMAPEQFMGRREERGSPADVWSLGVMLHQYLSGGQYPFDAPSLVHLMRKLQQPPPPLVDVPAPLARLCRDALSAAPDQRPTAAEFAERIRGHLADADRDRNEAPRWSAARRWLAAGAGALLTGGVLLAVVPTAERSSQAPPGGAPEAGVVEPTESPADAPPPAPRGVNALIRSPEDGEHLQAPLAYQSVLTRLGGERLAALVHVERGPRHHAELWLSRDDGASWRRAPPPDDATLGAPQRASVASDRATVHLAAITASQVLTLQSFDPGARRWSRGARAEQPPARSGWAPPSLVVARSGKPVVVGHRRGAWDNYLFHEDLRRIPQRITGGLNGTCTSVAAGRDGALHFSYRSFRRKLPWARVAPGDYPYYHVYEMTYRRWSPVLGWGSEVPLGLHTSNRTQLRLDPAGLAWVLHEEKDVAPERVADGGSPPSPDLPGSLVLSRVEGSRPTPYVVRSGPGVAWPLVELAANGVRTFGLAFVPEPLVAYLDPPRGPGPLRFVKLIPERDGYRKERGTLLKAPLRAFQLLGPTPAGQLELWALTAAGRVRFLRLPAP